MVTAAAATMNPSNILLSLLVGGKDDAKRFTSATSRIHQTVYGLKEEYPDLFADFVFNPNRLFPYCEQIDEALASFRWNRLIGMENIGFRAYTVKAMAERIYERDVKPTIDATMAAKLEEASKTFWAALGEG